MSTAPHVVPAAIHEFAREGADSVFRFLARTAERVPDGVRWLTFNEEEEGNPASLTTHYEGSVFSGVSGIPYFLAAYHTLTGDQKALDLAAGAARWCSAPDRAFIGEGVTANSLCFGRSGAGLAWLHVARASGDPEHLAQARPFGDCLLTARIGPLTDFLGGVAGELLFLIRLYEATREDRYLDAARARAGWLATHAHRDGDDVSWPYSIGPRPDRTFAGFAHGIAGIAHVVLSLYAVTRESVWADLGRGVATALSRVAHADHGGLNWPYFLKPEDARGPDPNLCQWCHGAPGIGLLFAKAYELLGESSFLETARLAGETIYARGDVRSNPSQCHGLAGNAELFVELYRLTRDPLWLERAHDFAQTILSYRVRTSEGDVWNADDPGSTSPDFLCGAAGVGSFFVRLADPDRFTMPLL